MYFSAGYNLAKIVDVKIDDIVRGIVQRELATLSDLFGYDDLQTLPDVFGVQLQTFLGWTEGRGSPAPKTTNGRFLHRDNIPEQWRDRIIAGLALRGQIRQVGNRGQLAEYVEDIGEAPFHVILDRVRAYLNRDTGDDWTDAKWRNLEIVSVGRGRFILVVTYARGDSSEEAEGSYAVGRVNAEVESY